MLLWKLLTTDQLQNKDEATESIWIVPRMMSADYCLIIVRHFQQYFSYVIEVSFIVAG